MGSRSAIGAGWHENGQLRAEGELYDGVPVGPWVEFWPNGQMKSQGTYRMLSGEKEPGVALLGGRRRATVGGTMTFRAHLVGVCFFIGLTAAGTTGAAQNFLEIPETVRFPAVLPEHRCERLSNG